MPLAEKYKPYILFAALLVIIYFPLFLHLTDLPIRIWDESILGSNAIQMAHNHNFIVTYSSIGAPDMYVTKPPLVVWCVTFFSGIFGFGELALRLPSALAGLALCIYLFWLLKKQTGSAVFAFFSVLILVTSRGFIRNHVTRTGEYDAMLVLFSVTSSLQFFKACHPENVKVESKYIFGFFILITLAFLTKGIAALLFTPGLLVYALLTKKVWPFLKNKWFYAGVAFFIFFGIGYYLLRESMNPGFIKAVWYNELGGRFVNTNEGHHGPLIFYLNEIIDWQFTPYLYAFPLGLLAGLLLLPPAFKRLTAFAGITGVLFFTVISVSATKIGHYDAILFPYLAIITASFFYFMYTSARYYLQNNKPAKYTAAAFALTLCFFIKPYYDIFETVYHPKGDYWEEGFTNACRYFQYSVAGKFNPGHNKPVFSHFQTGEGDVLFCYANMMKQHGLESTIISEKDIEVHDHIVLFDSWQAQQLQQQYNLLSLTRLDFCDAVVYEVQSKKQATSTLP